MPRLLRSCVAGEGRSDPAPIKIHQDFPDDLMVSDGVRGEWGMTGMLSLMLYIFGVSADVGSSL